MTTRKSKGSSGADLERKILGQALNFGEAVGALRIGEEMTQSEFAAKLGVSRQYLCDIERGRRRVSPEQAAKFAAAFGHPPNVLVQLALQDAVYAGGLK